MYSIIKQADGTYLCECVIQDGTERWTKATLEDAIQSLKEAGKALNGWDKVRKKDISYYVLEQVVETKRVEVKRKEMG